MHKSGLVHREAQQADVIVPFKEEMMNIVEREMVAKEEGNLLGYKMIKPREKS